MIGKTQVNAIVTQYIQSLPGRIDQALMAAAQAGVIGGTFPYPASTSQAAVNAYVTQAQAAGWTAVNDNVGFTVTLS